MIDSRRFSAMRTSAFQAVRSLSPVALAIVALSAPSFARAAEPVAAPKPALASKATDAPPPMPEEKETPSARNASTAAPPEEVAKLLALKHELDDLSGISKQFELEAKEFRRDASDLIQRKLDEKKQELSKFYDKQIRQVETGERAARVDAIAVFERFIQLYPDDPKYTPDSMTRLAELYYEKTVDDQQLVMADYEDRVRLGSDEAPPEQQRSFEKSIALYQEIITRFPDYRLADSIYYLLGWCLGEQGEPEQARDVFKALTDKFPKSKYVPEAWVRIGEYYFDYQPSAGGVQDVNAKLQEAINAYKNALGFKDSPFYDKALYKLGWAYYRIDDFDNAVDSFIRLIDYYDDMKKAGKDTGGDLRNEALQYTAVSFADDKWGPTHSLADFFKNRGPRAYEYELFKKLGDIQFDKTQYKDAIANYTEVIRRNPMAPDAPATQERIIQSYARLQDRENAFRERTVLADTYGDKSQWAINNKENQDALDAARELIEKALLLTAQYYHEQAEEFAKQAADESQPQEARDAKRANAIKAYKDAAGAYANYLKQFPRSKNAYDISYLYAETLYNSLQFKIAADAFAAVRDSNADNKYLVNAAYYVVLSLQREIESEERQGMLEKRDPCTVDKCKDIKDFKPQAIPEIRLKLVEAADIYLQKTPTAEDAPILSYKAGQTFYIYYHFDEAIERYDDVIKRFPDKDVAVYAYEDELIQSMLVKDWVRTEDIATKMLDLKQIQSDPKKFEEKRLVKYGARFEIANQLMAKKDWDGAAKKYMSVVTDTEAEAEQHGKWPNSDKALFNAAACFKAEYKYDSAMRTYEKLYTDYPKSELAEQSLFFVAENAEKAFEFDKAIDRYRLLVKTYPKSKDAQAAQFNAARRLEALQRYKEAADEYKKYATLFPNESDAPDMMYQAAIMYQRQKDTWGLITNLQTYIQKNTAKTEQHERIVQARLKIANAFVELKKDSDAKQTFKQVVADFEKFKMTKDNYNAAQAASEAAFALAEENFATFQSAKFDPKGRGNKLVESMKDQLKSLATKLQAVKDEYGSIIVKYQWPEWMTAALFRMGYADDLFAQKILASPCPKEIKNLGEDACDAFNAQLSEQMAPVLEKAANEYQTAADKARDLRVVNKWTKLAMEKVCENTPANCRSMKDPREQLISESLSPLPLTADVNGSRAVVYDPPPPPPAPAPKPAEAADAKGAATAPAIGVPPPVKPGETAKKDDKAATGPVVIPVNDPKGQPMVIPVPPATPGAAAPATTPAKAAPATTTPAPAPGGTTTTATATTGPVVTTATAPPAKPAAKPATTAAPAAAAAPAAPADKSAPGSAAKSDQKAGGAP
jgi:TolA-binding protein